CGCCYWFCFDHGGGRQSVGGTFLGVWSWYWRFFSSSRGEEGGFQLFLPGVVL
ncbi:hypothetical protein A2U01_0065792, partial [Trifolium medium]|nr:hypothetical protein [Trifolium medium]